MLSLVQRVRALLAGDPSTREISMFGGISFMVHDRMIASARATGDLLVRIDQRRDAELIATPGASRAEMGHGRTMGPGWVLVSGDSIASAERLSFWIDVARESNERAAND